jgi:hypothetical protein
MDCIEYFSFQCREKKKINVSWTKSRDSFEGGFMSFLTLFALLIGLLEVFCPRIEFYMMVGSGVYVDYFFL